MDGIGLPIIYFLSNLYRAGVTVTVVNGQLRIGGAIKQLSPVYREEIRKRAEFIVDLLAAEVPDPLQPYMGRLIKLREAETAQEIANQMGVPIQLTPTNGGWLMTIPNTPVARRQGAREERG
jgi:hypothetical protein